MLLLLKMMKSTFMTSTCNPIYKGYLLKMAQGNRIMLSLLVKSQKLIIAYHIGTATWPVMSDSCQSTVRRRFVRIEIQLYHKCLVVELYIYIYINPVNIFLFKANTRNTRKRYEICSKVPIKIPERRQWRLNNLFAENKRGKCGVEWSSFSIGKLTYLFL